jgi:hypothetical protein
VAERLFKVRVRGSSLGTEAMGGLTTFLTMCYIVTINPPMLALAGVPFSAALTATCFGAAIMTLAMGLITNRPIALVSGLSTSTVLVYGICLGQGADWRVGMACVMLEGLLILVLVAFGVREAVLKAIPVDLRHAISIGWDCSSPSSGSRAAGSWSGTNRPSSPSATSEDRPRSWPWCPWRSPWSCTRGTSAGTSSSPSSGRRSWASRSA